MSLLFIWLRLDFLFCSSCCFLFFSFYLLVGYFCLVCDCHTGWKLENNASPSLPAAIHSQTAGGGGQGPQCYTMSNGPQLFCDATASNNSSIAKNNPRSFTYRFFLVSFTYVCRTSTFLALSALLDSRQPAPCDV